MKMLRRAAAGAASAGAAITARYIDEQLAAQRAQMLSELQRSTAQRVREDDEAFRNDPTRVQRERERKAEDFKFGNKVQRDAKLEELNDGELTAAQVGRDSILSKAKNKQEIERATEMLPLEVKRAYAIADAQGRGAARNREAPGADLAAKLAMVEKTLGRPMTEPEKLGLLGLAKGRDPELDTQTVEDERINADGSTTKTTRKEVRRPGGAAPAQDDPLLAALEAARAAKQPKDGAAPAAAEPGATGQPASLMNRAKAGVQAMDGRTLARIAAIPGHAQQQQAAAEIERRRTGKTAPVEETPAPQ